MWNKRSQIGALLVFVLLLFLPAVRYGLVSDDIRQIQYNIRLTEWSFVPGYFTTDLWAHEPSFTHGYYRPLFLLWLRLSDALLGRPGALWHLPSILAHVGVVLCVFLLLLRLVKDFKGAALGAALFAIHPIQTEAVVWISASGDLLLTLFAVLSVYFYAARKGAVSWVSILFCLLAMFTKETGIVIPVLLFAYEWIETRFKEACLQSAPYFAAGFVYVAIRMSALGRFTQIANPDMTPSAMALMWPRLLAEYVFHLLWPVRLSLSYNVPVGGTWWQVALLIAVVAAVVWGLWRSEKIIRFGAAWFAITLMPAMTLRYVNTNDYLHDRYLYLPMVGLALMAGALMARVRFTWVWSVAAGAVAAALCWGTCVQVPIWKDNISLYTRAVECAPDNPEMILSLAAAHMMAHHEAEAYPLFKELVERYPESQKANFNMARYYEATGDTAQAGYYYSIAQEMAGHAGW